ncbi:MAG: DUF1624 domain-containing protein, partial [Clostridia bacterium]|nr:DUF1624 domain-containing protein [Clostridia bacterium]
MKLRELLSDGQVNTGRQTELDFGKALPVLCLPFVHCFIECTASEGLDHGIPFLFDYVIGSPISAPMFMFCMGVGIVYTKKSSASDLAKRAGKLFLIGLLLNVCRFLLPYLAGYAITGEAGKYLEPLVYRVFGNDILQFASLCFLCIALFVKLKIPDGIRKVRVFFYGSYEGTPDFRIRNFRFSPVGNPEDAGILKLKDLCLETPLREAWIVPGDSPPLRQAAQRLAERFGGT